ncbi:homeobox domain protein, partial [Ancylostoma duodenale]
MRAWLADKDAVQRLLVKERVSTKAMQPFLSDLLYLKLQMDAGLPLEKNLVNGNGKRLSDPPYEPPPRKVQFVHYFTLDRVIGGEFQRTIITEQQKEALRFVFQHEHHPSQKTVELLSLKLNLNIRTVNNWFHNHRTRQKASLKEGKVYPPAVTNLPTSKNWQQ